MLSYLEVMKNRKQNHEVSYFIYISAASIANTSYLQNGDNTFRDENH